MGVVVEKSEKRSRVQRGSRIPFQARVEMIRKETGERSEGEAYDLSMGGMYIKTILPFRPGTVFDVDVQMKPLNYRGTVRVLWEHDADDEEDRPYGMAVAWVDPTPNQKRLLSLLIDDHVRGGGKLIEGDPYEASESPRVGRVPVAPAAAANRDRNRLIVGLAVAVVVVVVVVLVLL